MFKNDVISEKYVRDNKAYGIYCMLYEMLYRIV
jgi:hypothetical protein